MPTRPKTLDVMAKNMTKAEIAAREAAEAAVLPLRPLDAKRPPASLAGDTKARRYWREVLDSLEGTSILDGLDRDALSIYCSMLARRDYMDLLCRRVLRESKEDTDHAESLLELVSKLDTLLGKLQTHEKTLLQYADKLGLTPSGRVRLAKRRAAATLAPEAEDDLYGD